MAGPWELGTIQSEGKKKLARVAEQIRAGIHVCDLDEEFDSIRIQHNRNLCVFEGEIRQKKIPKFRQVQTLVLWGETGVGKTRWTYDHFELEDIYKLTEPDGKLWFDGYNGQGVLLIDDFSGWIKYKCVFCVLNLYFFNKTK